MPAIFKTVTRSIVDVPASAREIEVPAVTRTVARKVIDTPATVREVDVPAVYRTASVSKVIEEAKANVSEVPAQYATTYKTVKVADARFETRSILCETNATPSRIKEIQVALKGLGFDLAACRTMAKSAQNPPARPIFHPFFTSICSILT